MVMKLMITTSYLISDSKSRPPPLLTWFWETIRWSNAIEWRLRHSWNGHIGHPMTSFVDLRMVVKFRACNLIYFKGISFWYPFFKTHQTTFHLDISVWLREFTHTPPRRGLYNIIFLESYFNVMLYYIILFFGLHLCLTMFFLSS